MGDVIEPDRHFLELRQLIDERLSRSEREEYARYPWLYGALGNPEADVMFVCENPSRAGVEWADRKFAHLGIEAQWRGHRADRFRRVLQDRKLKRGGSGEKGGWRCYITNVIKSMDTVKDFKALPREEKEELACHWADVLQWEICRVRPKIVFCVGMKSWRAMQHLRKNRKIDLGGAPLHRIWHYSAPRSDSEVRARMREGIDARCSRRALRE